MNAETGTKFSRLLRSVPARGPSAQIPRCQHHGLSCARSRLQDRFDTAQQCDRRRSARRRPLRRKDDYRISFLQIQIRQARCGEPAENSLQVRRAVRSSATAHRSIPAISSRWSRCLTARRRRCVGPLSAAPGHSRRHRSL